MLLLTIPMLLVSSFRYLGVLLLAVAAIDFVNAWRAWKRLPNRKPFRFSLRTLLIAITLVAVVLGAIVYAAR